MMIILLAVKLFLIFPAVPSEVYLGNAGVQVPTNSREAGTEDTTFLRGG